MQLEKRWRSTVAELAEAEQTRLASLARPPLVRMRVRPFAAVI